MDIYFLCLALDEESGQPQTLVALSPVRETLTPLDYGTRRVAVLIWTLYRGRIEPGILGRTVSSRVPIPNELARLLCHVNYGREVKLTVLFLSSVLLFEL
jgi:hypothetical protein